MPISPFPGGSIISPRDPVCLTASGSLSFCRLFLPMCADVMTRVTRILVAPMANRRRKRASKPALGVPDEGAPREAPQADLIESSTPVEADVPAVTPPEAVSEPEVVVVPREAVDISPPRSRGPQGAIARRRRLPRRKSVLIGSGLFLAGLITGGVIVAGWLADQAPAWWEPVDASNPHTVAVADAVENGAVDLLSEVRPSVERTPGLLTSEAWTVRLTPEEVNAWLAVRLPMWIRNQSDNFRWPSQVAQLQVDFRHDDIVLGVRAVAHGTERYLWVTLDPTIDEDGALWLRATWVHVGRLALPANWFLPDEAGTPTPAKQGTAIAGGGGGGAAAAAPKPTLVTKNIPDDIRALPATGTLLAALNGNGPVAKNPTIRLADGRRVRIVGIVAEDGALFVTCRTEVRQ